MGMKTWSLQFKTVSLSQQRIYLKVSRIFANQTDNTSIPIQVETELKSPFIIV